MAKNKNKGFSLIEIVIAIAILTLLLTPILRQLSQTMSTNRKAKEQQYANENAEYILQYVQTNSRDVLETSDATAEIYKINTSDTVTATRTCQLQYIDAAGTVQSVPGGTIEYTTYMYRINDVELGSNNTVYERTVVYDDLANRIKSFTDTSDNSYRVAYNIDTVPVGYELTSEGSAVQYTTVMLDLNGDGEDEEYKYVSSIICKTYSGVAVTDPNEFNMGNVHSLDASQMALINGYSTEKDEQARDDFYAELLEYLKVNNYSKWQQVINGNSNVTSSEYLDGMRKLTTINITDDVTKQCYVVSVDVTYENTIGATDGAAGTFIQKNYTIFAQEFSYAESVADGGEKAACPEIYFEFQPFAVDTASGEVIYADNEYIIINNQVKDAKIYLYKPTWDQALTTIYNSSLQSHQEYKANMDNYATSYYVNNFDVDITNSDYTEKVKINIASANMETEDNVFTIYTNLDLGTDNPQFVLDNTGAYTSYFYKYTTVGGETTSTKRTVSAVSSDWLKSIDDEDTTGERLYTVTITLDPVKDNVNEVVLTGAKGAN